MSSTDLTFRDIEQGLVEVTDRRDEAALALELAEAESPMWGDHVGPRRALAEAEAAVAAYLRAEIAKVDSLHAWIMQQTQLAQDRKAEADRLYGLAKRGENAVAWIKQLVVDVLRETGKKKVEGNRGRLRRQGNGGKRPVEIRQSELLPAKFQRFTIMLNKEELHEIADALDLHFGPRSRGSELVSRAKPTDPDTEAIRQELEMLDPCPAGCDGGRVPETIWKMGETIELASETEAAEIRKVLGKDGTKMCERCGGSGTVPRGVPGAVLLERSEHLRVE